MGLVSGLAQPDGTVTSVTDQVGLDFHAKRLQLLLEVVPGVTRVAALQQAAMVRAVPARAHIQQAAEEAARRPGVLLEFMEVDAPDELEGAFAAMRRKEAEALLMFFSPFFSTHRRRLMELVAQHRLLGIFESRAYVEAGGLMSYNVSYAALFRPAASYADRILKGAKPADLPVEQPTTFELVINLKTAQALGLTLPPTLLFQADEVIR
jgi:putative ABC transport system substrate-binding protein